MSAREQPRRFKRYPRYKESGVEWLGEIPEHWQVMRLGFNAEFIVPMRDKPPDLTGETPWIRIEDFDGRYIFRSKTDQRVSSQTIREMNLKVFPVGTVLCSCSCAMGATAIVSEPLVSNQTFIGIVPGKGLASEYVFYLMQVAKEHLAAIATGAIQQYLSRNDFGSLRMPLLPIGEQRAIASFLHLETAKIDALVAKKQQLIELLQEKRAALITRAVTKGLDPNVPMKDSGVEWLGEIPAHWVMMRLKQVCERVFVGVAEATTFAYVDDGVPLLRSTDVRANRVRTDEIRHIDKVLADRLSTKRLRAGDIVTVRTGNAGVSALVPMEYEGGQCFTLVVSRPGSSADGCYLCYLLNAAPAQQQFRVEGVGTAQVNISVPIVQNIVVSVPPREEQARIANWITQETSRLDALSMRIRDAVKHLKELRTALISAAVTGKIDVREEAA